MTTTGREARNGGFAGEATKATGDLADLTMRATRAMRAIGAIRAATVWSVAWSAWAAMEDRKQKMVVDEYVNTRSNESIFNHGAATRPETEEVPAHLFFYKEAHTFPIAYVLVRLSIYFLTVFKQVYYYFPYCVRPQPGALVDVGRS